MAWQKVFENQASGTSGSIGGLIAAIKGGADVKVAYELTGSEEVFWSRPFSSVTIASIGGSGLFSRKSAVVSGIVVNIPDTDVTVRHRPSSIFVPFGTQNGLGGRKFIQRPFSYEWQIFNTSGERHVVKFDAVTQQTQPVSTSALRMHWYVSK
jgi:hypothetical protein